MKEKIISMTSDEFATKYGRKSDAEIKAMVETAPEYSFKEMGLNPLKGKPIARGFEEFQEYLKEKGEPLIEVEEDPKVNISIRIPRSYATGLRATGRGWQTRVGEYLVKGIKRGDLGEKMI